MRIIMCNDKVICTCKDGMVGETIDFLHTRDRIKIESINRTLSSPVVYAARTYTAVPTLEELKRAND